MFNVREWSKQANIVADVLSRAPKIDKTLRVGIEEFQRRQKAVYAVEQKNRPRIRADCFLIQFIDRKIARKQQNSHQQHQIIHHPYFRPLLT